MENIYIGRQPIVDTNSDIYAYELLYRDKNMSSTIHDERFASANVISNVLNKFGKKELLGDYKAFVKIDKKFLMHDLIFSIPSDIFVFSIMSTIELDEYVRERIEQLHEKGYTLAINDTDLKENTFNRYEMVLDKIRYFKINDPKDDWRLVSDFVAKLKERDVKVVVTKIDTIESFEQAKACGCELVQGFFFAKPKVIENKKIDPTNLNVMRLYNMLLEETSIDDLATAFEQNHEITIQLLRYINSGAFHFRKKISSIHQILVLLGRETLAKWLMLIIYSKSTNRQARKIPLMLMVKHRTNLMEHFVKLTKPDARSNLVGEAYFVGVLSLLDVLFGVDLQTILSELNVSDEVKEAILEEKGYLGEILHVVKALEYLDTKEIDAFVEKYKLDKKEFDKVITDSIEDVNSFEKLL